MPRHNPAKRPDTQREPKLPHLGGHDDDEPMTARTVPNVSALAFRFEPLYETYRQGWTALFEAMKGTLDHLDDELREQALADLAKNFPAVVDEPEFRAYQNPIPVHEGTIASQRGTNLVRATVALNGLQQLAAVYHPTGHALDTPEEVALFLERIFEVLELFLRCFIPLRDGYRAFTTQMDLNTRGEGVPIVGSQPTVDTAANATELGAALLDWKRPVDPNRPHPSQHVEWVFADLMIHHMAMITGVMQGVKSLLAELAPSAIERALDDPKRGAGGLQIGPFRYKQLWEMYTTRHSDLTDEDKETFALIFGADFARAYSQLATDTLATAAHRMSSQFPTRTPSAVKMPAVKNPSARLKKP